MTCQEFESLVEAFVDGEFEGSEYDDAQSHLAECASCRATVDFKRAFKKRVKESALQSSSLNPPSPSSLRANIMAGIAKEPIDPASRKPFYVRPVVVGPFLLAVAACAVVIIHNNSGNEQTEALVSAAVAHHQRQWPLDVQDAQLARVRSWLQGKVDFATSSIPDIQNAQLLGARLSSLNGRPAAYVVYDSPSQRRVSLIVFGAPDVTVPHGRRINDHDVLLANQRGYNVALWKDREIVYSLVSDLDEQDILQLVAASKR